MGNQPAFDFPFASFIQFTALFGCGREGQQFTKGACPEKWLPIDFLNREKIRCRELEWIVAGKAPKF
jgi:hypothetical protein